MGAAPQVLDSYARKRNFERTPEPRPARVKSSETLSFVIQKHWASHLHYDFRLELDGVLLSWAVPKGPSYDPKVKQMAIHVEDHPVSYGSFEGEIPKGQYGAGSVILWDTGTWEPVADPHDGLKKGKLIFKLHGQKLAGLWELVRISKPGERKQDQWMLFKKRGDAWARSTVDYDVIRALPDSVIEHPLGPIEEREPRGAPARRESVELDLTGAVKGALPAALKPQLASLAAEPPGGDWIVEHKFDGYRLLARLDKGKVRLITRNGHDWTDRLAALAASIEHLGIRSAWLDGEMVALDDHGVPHFNDLQNAIDSVRSADLSFFVFDLPFHDGQDLRAVPLVQRRALLQRLIGEGNDQVRFSPAFDALPSTVKQAACELGLEGVMLKRADAPYVSGRTETWLKLKCSQRQEFVVVGFIDRAGAATEVGSLLLAYHDGAELKYAGNVGTGWSSRVGQELHTRLRELETSTPPLDAKGIQPGRWSKRRSGGERWVRPELVIEVAFAEWTPDNHVRHASFKGLRADVPAASVRREVAMRRPTSAPAALAAPAIKVTHGDRVIDASTGFTKADLVRYYESIGERILPHLKGRPVSLVRAPQGLAGALFFQKHPETRMPGLKVLDAKLWPGHESLLEVHSIEALLMAAQMNTIEFHTWNSTARSIDKPDRVIFDLDPGEGVTWNHVQESATLVRAMLEALGLKCWLKTSGGKGLHVVVPLAPRRSYEEVKAFSQAVVKHMAATLPQRFVAKSGPSNRVGRIFIDYLRNGHAQTTAAAFSARARPGMGVSIPIDWSELDRLKSGAQWTIATAREHLSFERSDPWAELWSTKQSLTQAIRML